MEKDYEEMMEELDDVGTANLVIRIARLECGFKNHQ